MTRANRRFYRTLLLGLLALGVLIWAAVDQFGIPWRDMSELLLGTLWIAGGAIVLAALCTLLWVGLRALLRRDDTQ